MAQECLLLLFVVFYSLIILSVADGVENCPKFHCGRHGEHHFPFTNTSDKPECGLYIKGCDDGAPQVQMENEEWHDVTRIFQKEEENSISVKDPKIEQLLSRRNCTVLDDYNPLPPPLVPEFPPMISVSTLVMPSRKLFRCNKSSRDSDSFHSLHCSHDSHSYGFVTPGKEDQFKSCSSVQLPVGPNPNPNPNASLIPNFNPYDIRHFLTDEITITVTLSPHCRKCYYERGGQCRFAEENFECVGASATEERRSKKATIIGLVIGCPVGLGLLILLFYKRRCTTSKFRYQSRNIYADRSLNPEPESSTVFFGIPVFSCKELEEATNNFDSARELGDGGFGTVYYGILRDGREVAVKRLYEHSYRRVEQFLNEIAILTRLRHRNLVSFYGCTSRNSRELLLVYEYIPNGTVACHLHGDLAKPSMMPWPPRMKIAIEIASALAYLHASDIIHRDVKTNNILLDNSFCVKVADFGLSRLFPNNVTHASTAPQGTPGYVDPEYCQCYQLTNKSDVYSFGVVLIELISSLPAVDIDRQRDEINLANLAIKKIENREVSDLVDPSLGFGTNKKVKRMIESVAELALQCLQLAKEYRPSMDEVLEELKRIESGKDKDAPNYFEESDVHVDGISIHVDGVSNRYVRPPKLQ